MIAIWKSEMERNPLFYSYKIAPGIDMGNLIRATHTGLACLVPEYSHYQHCTEVLFEKFNMLCHYIWYWLRIQVCILHWDGYFDLVGVIFRHLKSRDGRGWRSSGTEAYPIVSVTRRRSLKNSMRCSLYLVFFDNSGLLPARPASISLGKMAVKNFFSRSPCKFSMYICAQNFRSLCKMPIKNFSTGSPQEISK